MSASLQNSESPVVFLLHGWGVDSSTLEGVRTHISKYYKAVSLGLPGFGGVPEPNAPWGVGEYARKAVADILEHLQTPNQTPHETSPETPPRRKVILFGHSFGARIIIKMLGDEQISASLSFDVEKCIITGGAGIKPARDAKYHAKVGLYRLSKKLLPKAAQAKIAARNGSEDYNAASGIMRQTFVKVINEDLTPLLPRLKPETLLIWGELDDATPLSDGETMEKLIPDAGLAKIASAGHYTFLEKPNIFYAILDAYLSLDAPRLNSTHAASSDKPDNAAAETSEASITPNTAMIGGSLN